MVVTIIEGGELSFTLARILLLLNHRVNVIRQENKGYSNNLNELGVNVVSGTVIDLNVLSQSCIKESDVVISLMESDIENLESCVIIKNNFNNKKTISKVNNPNYVKKFEQVGIDIAFFSESFCSKPISLDRVKQ